MAKGRPPEGKDANEPPSGWWETVLASTSDAVCTLDPGGTITSWNPGAEKLSGCAAADVIGENVRRIVPPGRQAEMSALLTYIADGAQIPPFESELLRNDGTIVPISVTITPLAQKDGSVQGAAIIARDITERMRFEDLLAREVATRESYEEQLVDLNRRLHERLTTLETLVDVLPVGIAIAYDRECREVRVNEAFGRMFRVGTGMISMADGYPGEGTPFHLSDGKDPMPSDAFPLHQAATGQAVAGLELDLHFEDGGRAHALCYAAPLAESGEEPHGAICAFIDVTQKREAEHQLRRANEIKDEFLAMVSHELRTPLTVVLGLARFLSRDIGHVDAELLQETLAQMRSDAERLANVLENMLILSRLDFERIDLEPIRVASVVERAVGEHRNRFPHRNIEIELDSVRFIEGNTGWLEQIVANLLTNAEKYSPREEPVQIRVADERDAIQIRVSDRGPGIQADDAAELFEPFYRSKRAVDAMIPGLGLGLTVGKRLTELQGGSIEARPRDGGGAEFVVTLPMLVYET